MEWLCTLSPVVAAPTGAMGTRRSREEEQEEEQQQERGHGVLATLVVIVVVRSWWRHHEGLAHQSQEQYQEGKAMVANINSPHLHPHQPKGGPQRAGFAPLTPMLLLGRAAATARVWPAITCAWSQSTQMPEDLHNCDSGGAFKALCLRTTQLQPASSHSAEAGLRGPRSPQPPGQGEGREGEERQRDRETDSHTYRLTD